MGDAAGIRIGSIEIEDSGEEDECVDNPLVETAVVVEIVINDDDRHLYYIEDFFGSGSSNLFQQLDKALADGVLRWTTLEQIKRMLSEFTPQVIEYVLEVKPKEIALVVPISNPELESYEVYYISDDDDDQDMDDFVDDDEEEEFDEEQLEIDEADDMNHPTVKPASKASVESLEKVKLDEACLVGSRKHCPICFDAMEVDSAAAKMPCSHIFHHGCLVQWLQLKNTCPLCRFKMPTD